jgi:cobalt-zinc-cadmium efflux system protein
VTAHSHPHSHGNPADRDVRLLLVALLLVTLFMVAEVVVAVLASSLALLADAGHMLTDGLALGAAAWAARLAVRPATGRWTFGLARAEIVSAAVNGMTLLVVSAVVTAEAVRRLIDPPDVAGLALVIVAGVGLVVNSAVVAVLARADRGSLNVAGAFAHVLTDAYAFAATLIAGVVVLTAGWRRADAVASLLVVVLMLRAAWLLLRDSGHVLLEAAPVGVALDEIRMHLLDTTDVIDVHDLHVWTVTSRLPSLSAHVVVDERCFLDGSAPRLLDELQECISGHFDVEHSTFQLEPAGHTAHEPGTH